jgi:hypothetical protein
MAFLKGDTFSHRNLVRLLDIYFLIVADEIQYAHGAELEM